MPPPEAPVAGKDAGAMEKSSVVFARPQTLRRRSDFLKAARGLRQSTPGFILQARKRSTGEATGIRVGFTCSKKVGNAAARNRAKRRLREIAFLMLPEHGKEGWDYVLVGRAQSTAESPFESLLVDLKLALEKIHSKRS